MARFKTFVAGGTILPTDLNSIEDDYEFLFSTYRDLLSIDREFTFSGINAAGTYVLAQNLNQAGSGQGAGTAQAITAIYLDPADFTVAGRTAKCRVRAFLAANAVATGVNWTVGLYPVTAFAGNSGLPPTISTLGAVVAGSTVTFTAPGAGASVQGNSGDFTAPAAGFYALCVANSGSNAANSEVSVTATIQTRQV